MTTVMTTMLRGVILRANPALLSLPGGRRLFWEPEREGIHSVTEGQKRGKRY